MIPSHCSHVGMVHLSGAVERDTIVAWLAGRNLYQGTTHLVFTNGETWAVVAITCTGKGLFCPVRDFAFLGVGAEEVAYLHSPQTDTLNHWSMAKAAAVVPHPIVVIEGEFDHISFIHKEPAIPLYVIDLVPPSPPKLVVLVERALALVSHDRPVEIVPVLTDLQPWVTEAVEREVVLPCRCSGWDSGGHSLCYLEEKGTLQNPTEALLVGCDLSRKVFLATYHVRPHFRDICPRSRLDQLLPKARSSGTRPLVLAKCCDLIEQVQAGPDGVVTVPWGARFEDIVTALGMVFSSRAEGVPSPRE